MKNDIVYLEVNNGIGTIYFNRANKRNAMNLEMWQLTSDLLDICEEEDDVKVVILRGVDGTAFSAGADISEFPKYRTGAENADRYNRITMDVEAKIKYLSKPTIALIQGYCIGGGCEIAAACDFRFSDQTGKFAINSSKVGHVYYLQSAKNLIDVVGTSHAKDILYSGRLLKAEESYRMGLINQLWETEELVDKTYKYAEQISQNSQYAVQGTKKVINKIVDGYFKETEEVAALILGSFDTDYYKEATKAFLEKRVKNQ